MTSRASRRFTHRRSSSTERSFRRPRAWRRSGARSPQLATIRRWFETQRSTQGLTSDAHGNDRVVAPFRMSANEALQKTFLSKHVQGLRDFGGGMRNLTCARRCAVQTPERGFSVRLHDMKEHGRTKPCDGVVRHARHPAFERSSELRDDQLRRSCVSPVAFRLGDPSVVEASIEKLSGREAREATGMHVASLRSLTHEQRRRRGRCGGVDGSGNEYRSDKGDSCSNER